MTELVELINKHREEMYDGIVEQWHEHMDRAYEAQPESLKRQMKHNIVIAASQSDAEAVLKAGDCEIVQVSHPVDVTAWGDLDPIWRWRERPRTCIDVTLKEADEAKLREVFNEACRIRGIIVWVPDGTIIPEAVGKIVTMMQNAWGDNPPYIELLDADRYFYSIKPVWELTE